MPKVAVERYERMKRITHANVSFKDDYIDDEEMKQEHPLKDGLPYQAFAIATDINNPNTWKLPHHTKAVKKAVKGKIGYEHTVDWRLIEEAVQLISLRGIEGKRVQASEGEILFAAKHLANHFIKAHRPLPDALAVLT